MQHHMIMYVCMYIYIYTYAYTYADINITTTYYHC